MDGAATRDPTGAVNAYAAAQGWPFRSTTVLEFDRPELNRLRDIWFDKAAGNPIPYRHDFDARALKPVLRNVVILEHLKNDGRWCYRIRLMGSELARLMGEKTGRLLEECVPPAVLPVWLTAFDTVMEAKVPLRFVTRYQTEPISYLTSESFNVPMLNAEGSPTLLLSCAYFQVKTNGHDLLS